MHIEKALDFIYQHGRSECDAFDVVAGINASSGISVFQGKLKDTEISNSSGIGVRVFRNGCPGYAFTESLEENALKQMFADAISHTEFTQILPIELPKPTLPGCEREHYHPEVENCSFEQMKELCLSIEKLSLESPEIENVPYLGSGKSVSQIYLMNSNGISYSRQSSHLSTSVGVVACRNSVKKLGVYSQVVFDVKDFDGKKIATKAVEKAKSLLGARSIASGNYPVIFSEEISGNVISMYASSFSADSVQKGNSRLKGLMNTQIASPCFTLLNDPTRMDLPGFATFDGEGVPTQKIEMVVNGKLNAFLYNLETAAKDGVVSNGCGARPFAGHVDCGFHNLIVESGGYSTEALMALFPRSLFITKLEGGSGCNAVSGELSIGAQGFYCENGEVIHPVEGLTLSTNFFDLLKNIVAVGSEYDDRYSTVQVPALAVSSISVSN